MKTIAYQDVEPRVYTHIVTLSFVTRAAIGGLKNRVNSAHICSQSRRIDQNISKHISLSQLASARSDSNMFEAPYTRIACLLYYSMDIFCFRNESENKGYLARKYLFVY